jgi:hypothetical protein
MKNKSLLLNSIIIIINIGIVTICIYYGFFGSISNNTVAGLLGGFLGFQFSHLFRYLGMTNSDFENTNINKEKAMKMWRYIILIFSVVAFTMQLMYVHQIIESLKIFSLYFLSWMIVTGNFRATIDPILETLTVYSEDDDVKRKTQRFSGKFTFISGIIGVILVLILPQNLSIYIAAFLFFVSTILPEFYAKHLFKQKYA